MCRVSTHTTGRSAFVRPFTSHCDSGPASIPILTSSLPLLHDARGQDDPDPIIALKGLHAHRRKDQAQPPRYTIFPRFHLKSGHSAFGPNADIAPLPCWQWV